MWYWVLIATFPLLSVFCNYFEFRLLAVAVWTLRLRYLFWHGHCHILPSAEFASATNSVNGSFLVQWKKKTFGATDFGPSESHSNFLFYLNRVWSHGVRANERMRLIFTGLSVLSQSVLSRKFQQRKSKHSSNKREKSLRKVKKSTINKKMFISKSVLLLECLRFDKTGISKFCWDIIII